MNNTPPKSRVRSLAMSSSSGPSLIKNSVGLYRALLRYSNGLTLTDRDYFRRRIRQEFVKAKETEDKKKVEMMFKKGLALLEKKTVV